MRNLYFADLKRILKDKVFLVTCILAGVFALINPLLNKAIFEMLDIGEMAALLPQMNAKNMLFSAFLPGDNLGLIMPILICIIVGKDFNQGTVRNKIISGHSRCKIFLSHLLSTATVMCSLMLVHGLLTLGVSLTVFPYQSGDFALGDFGYLLLSLLFEMIVYFAIAAIVTFFAVNAKNVGICILLYLATAIGSTIIGSIFQVAGMFVESGTIAYNVIEFINACNIYTSSLIGSGISYTAKEVLYVLVAPVVIGTGCTLLGIRMFARKNLK